MTPFRLVAFDGGSLSLDPHAPGRHLRADPRCFAGEPVAAFAHVCASPDPDAALPYDEPEVQHVRRDALAWWIPLLGDDLICLTTLAIDASRYAGAITVARTPDAVGSDPFARLFSGTVVECRLFAPVGAPPGPAIERYTGAPWPGGRFDAPA